MFQISRPCHFATGWRTERIIKVQCSSSERFSFPTLSCPISCLADLLVGRVSYIETKILHRSRWTSGRENKRTSLKTVTRHRATVELFWYFSLNWLHWTLILAYRAVQHTHTQITWIYNRMCIKAGVFFVWRCLFFNLPAFGDISERTVLTFSRPTSSLWDVGRNFRDKSTSPTRSFGERISIMYIYAQFKKKKVI